MAQYLLELFVGRDDIAAVEAGVARTRQAAAELTGEGMPVRWLCSIYLPEDETNFLLCEAASADAVLREGDEVALLPPVSGGAGAEVPRHIEIVDGPIDPDAIVRAVKAGSDGAVCVFDGIVRDNTRGRKTLYLDYEAYREKNREKLFDYLARYVAPVGEKGK